MAILSFKINAKDNMSKALRGIRGQISKLSMGMNKFGLGWKSFIATFGAIQLGSSFISANDSLEKLQLRLDAMLGSAKAGEQAFDWIKDFTKKLPFADLETTTDSFVELVSAGINPTTGALEGLLSASAKFGLTAGDIKGVTRALRQTTAVTNAQKQELNQLAERIPKIQRLIADEMGLEQDKFLKQMELRNLRASDVASATLRALEKEGKGVAEAFANTWQAKINMIKTAWFELMTAVGKEGLFDMFKDAVSGLATSLNKNRELITAFVNSVGMVFFDLGKQILNAFDLSGTDDYFKAFAKIYSEVVGALRIGLIKLKSVGINILDVFKGIKVQALIIKEQLSGIPLLGSGIKSPLDDMAQKIKDIKRELFSLGSAHITDEQYETQTEALVKYREDLKVLQKQVKDGIGGASLLSNLIGSPSETTEVKKQLAEVETTVAKQQIEINKAFDKARKDRTERLSGRVRSELEAPEFKSAMEKLIDPKSVTEEGSPWQQFSDGWDKALSKTTEKFKFAFDSMETTGKFFADTLTDSLTSGFDSFFDSLINGNIKSLKDAVLDFLKSIAKAISQQLSQQLAMSTISLVGGYLGGGPATFKQAQISDLGGGGLTDPTANFISGSRGLAKASQPTKVEIVNQSGESLRAKSAEVKQDPSGAIMSIVIDSISRNKGGSRDLLRTSLA